MSKPLFLLQQNNGPVLLNFPHSGTFVPEDIAGQLNQTGLALSDTDWHVPELYSAVKPQVSWLEATHSRYVIDLNRDPDGAKLYPGQAGTELCPTTDFDGREIYQADIVPDISLRLEKYFKPYHAVLRSEISRICAINGFCILLDCHSIKSKVPRLFAGQLPDLSLGSFSGASCAGSLADLAAKILQSSNFSFARDQRFKGGWITRNYGQPTANIHALQLEISQKTYMNEVGPNQFDPKFASNLQYLLKQLINQLNNWS